MPAISNPPVQSGDQYVIRHDNTATTTATDYTFANTQDTVTVFNLGSRNLVATANGVRQVIEPNDSETFKNVNIVTIQSLPQPIPFRLEGRTKVGSVGDGTTDMVARNLAQSVQVEQVTMNEKLDRISKIVVDIMNYKLPNETEYTLALGRAFAALPNGGTIQFPAGEFIANNVEISTKIFIKGMGKDSTSIRRNQDNPVFKITGTPLPNGGMPSHWNNGFQDLTIGSTGVFNTDLTKFQGVTGMTFYRMRFYAQECRLVYANQMWDSRFENVQFFEGGRDDGTPALELASGFDTYRMTKETVLLNCHFETYKGSAIRTSRDVAAGHKTHMMTFSNLKFESKFCTGNHLNLEVNNSMFSNVYISHQYTTTDVVMMKGCRGIQGNFAFFYIGSNVPASMINLDANCHLVDLRVLVSEPQPANSNIITQATLTNDTINISITSQKPLVNGVVTNKANLSQGTIWFDSKFRPRISAGRPSTLDGSGYVLARIYAGSTGSRPALTSDDIGASFYDTTLGKPVWWNGSAWKDSAGTTV